MSAHERVVEVALVAACTTLAVLAGGTAESLSSPIGLAVASVDGRVSIDARFRTATKGAFAISGAISDRGTLTAARRVTGARLQLTETLRGEHGTIRIRATSPCGGGAGTWTVLAATGEYEGLTGGGRVTGSPRCAGTVYPTRATYAGRVRTPAAPTPPPLAQPGRFAGGSSQRREVVFGVSQGGRALTDLRLIVETPCSGPTPQSRSEVRIALAEPLEIRADGSFSARAEGGFGTYAVTGRFTSPTTATGTAAATTSVTVTATNTTYPCSANVSWTASQPPPAAKPGTYCGFTLQGPGVCFDVAPSGREVARFEGSVVIRCTGRTDFELRVVISNIPIGGHLGFGSPVTAIEGLISGTARANGLLDPAGATASGSVSIQNASFDHEGTRYTCSFGSARWEATRQQ